METKRQTSSNRMWPLVLLGGCAMFACTVAACGFIAFAFAGGWLFAPHVAPVSVQPIPPTYRYKVTPAATGELAVSSPEADATATVGASLRAAPMASSPALRGPTAVLGPTPGPSPTVPTSAVVEDWRRFPDTDALAGAISVNEGWANNLVGIELVTGRQSAIAMAYQITALAPNDYVGFEWDLDRTQDWRGFDNLAVALQAADVSSRQLVVQFHELSGEVWRHRLVLSDAVDDASGKVYIALVPAVWEWADWSENRNLEMDLASVTRMGLFVGHTGPGDGAVTIGAISLEHR